MVELERVAVSRRGDRYMSIPEHCCMFEMPRGFFVDLPPVLTYAGRHLIKDLSSGVWTLFYTEWIAKFGAALLQEVYDRARLFWIPPAIRYYISEIDLSTVLGSPHNYEVLRLLVEKVGSIHWDAVSPRNQQRGNANRDRSPIAKNTSSGDFIYYDPWAQEECSPERAQAIADEERVVPSGHRTGYAYSQYADISWLNLGDNEGDEDVNDDEDPFFEDRQGEVVTEAPVEGPGARGSEGDVIMANSPGRTDTGELDRIPRNSTPCGVSGRDQSRDDIEVVRTVLREAGLAISEDTSNLPALVPDLQRELSRVSGAGPSTTSPRGDTETPPDLVHEYAEER